MIGSNKSRYSLVKIDIVKVYKKKDRLKQILKEPKLQKKHKLLEFRPLEYR